MRILFTLTAFLSSALLFMIEPMAARMILPTFGGSPQVWNSCLLFFQLVLLAGYAYAHFSATRLKSVWARTAQIVILGAALLMLPVTTKTAWFSNLQTRAESSGSPSLLVLVALVGLVGLPFLALSTNSSTLQRWYAQSGQPDADRPFFLYAAGNVGSLLALLAYPLYFEPRFTVGNQAKLWQSGFVIMALLVAACAIFSRRPRVIDEPVEAAKTPDPSRAEKIRWVALSAVPSSLLMGVTTYLTSNIAPIPLLWVVPLGLYLLTFILVFARRPMAPERILGRIYPLVLTPLVLTIILESDKPMVPLAILHLSVVFIGSWMCHSRLANIKPAADHLTSYFFWIAVGGVVGGIFNAIIAPQFFDTLAEYPAALIAAALLMPKRTDLPPSNFRDSGRLDGLYPLAVAVVMILLAVTARLLNLEASPLRTFMTIGLPIVLCFLAVDRPTRFGLSLAAGFMVAAGLHLAADATVPYTSRSFFGVHRVLSMANGTKHKLVHGNTIHGIQDHKEPELPLTYYYPNGPIGQVMTEVYRDRAALVGLGVGSLAGYGQPGQHFTYFEIDPVVRHIASDPRFFTFLKDSPAKVDIVMGDARLTLAKQPGKFGIIVLDAFSSDAIPVHLLTLEAMQMYLSHLDSDGYLMVHISNRYLDLQPVLAAAANRLQLRAYVQEDGADEDERAAGKTPSIWVMMVRNPKLLREVNKPSFWSELDYDPKTRPWTDDYSNVMGAFKTGAFSIGGD